MTQIFDCDGCSSNKITKETGHRIDDDINGEVFYVCDDCYKKEYGDYDDKTVDTATEFGEIVPEDNNRESTIL